MANIPASPFPIECSHRYYLVYDRIYDSYRDVVEDDVIYGLVKIPLSDAFDARFKFYNETTGEINLLVEEKSQAEWETMVAFDLFPVLRVFEVKHELHPNHATLDKLVVTVNKVRFNDTEFYIND
jgi:hypothetical protein